MNIGIDARPLTKYKAGIGYYLDDLLFSILKNDSINKYFLISDRKIIFDHAKFENLFFIEDMESKVYKKTLWYMVRLPKLVRKLKIDIFWGTQHVLPFYLDKNIKKVLTMHDLVYREMPETMQLYNRLINKIFIPHSVKISDIIFSVSESTKEGICKYFGKTVDLNKIKVIYSGGNVLPVRDDKEDEFFINHPDIVSGRFLLYIGTLEPRKNIATLLKAFEILREKVNIKLVLCGKIGWKASNIIKLIKNHKYKNDIIYLNYVSDMEKYILLKNCLIFIFPSLYEGFGLPVVEAMKMGSVAVVSKSSSLNELIEIEDIKFDALDSEELADKLVKLISCSNLYAKCKQYCVKRAEYFNWDDAAKKYIAIFNSLK